MTMSYSSRHPQRLDSAPMPPDDLAGVAEISAMLGVTKNTVLKYTRRPDFPEPLDRLATGPVWKRSDVEAWARERLPLRTGRPPKRNAQ